MEIKTCMATRARAYMSPEPIEKIKGIVLHSTGVNQPYVKRVIQPSNDDPNYAEIIADLGENIYHNSWNENNATEICHGAVGKNINGEAVCYNCLPYNYQCWGVYHGTKGSFNESHVQFEMMEDAHKDEDYFRKVVETAIDYCAYLCERFELSPSSIVSHYECGQMGYGSKHGDPENWFKDFGYTMDDFRAAVDAKLHPTIIYKKGDKVRLKDGVNTYANGKTIASFVRDADVLYVMASNDTTTMITIDSTLSQGSGWVRTQDIYLIVEDTTPVPKEEYDALKSAYDSIVSERDGLKSAYDNLCKSYDELAEDYDKVRKDHDTLWETTLDYKRTIDKIREIVQ